jgi:DNA-binding NarL/FixJ family response regulator
MAGLQSSMKIKKTVVRSISSSGDRIPRDIAPIKDYQEDALILIVDDDRRICKFLKKAISAWEMKAESISNPLQVPNKLKNNFYNLIFLDFSTSKNSGIDLIPEIVDLCPDTKIIITTSFAEKEEAIKALTLGAHDLLEKPFTPALLFHCLKRTLGTQKTEQEYKKVEDDLKRSHEDLLAHKSKLELLNKQLIETNNALSVLAQNIERTRTETEKAIVLKIRALILPIVEKIQQDRNLARYNAELTMLLAHVKDLTSGLGTDTEILATLTSTELRIASLIKNGLKTEEIAAYLYVSPDTVKTHRRNIRRKLNINNSMYNLRNYLGSKLGDGIAQFGVP